MKQIITLITASVLLAACKGNMYKTAPTHEQKLHNKGTPIEKYAPKHINDVSREAAARAAAASTKQ